MKQIKADLLPVISEEWGQEREGEEVEVQRIGNTPLLHLGTNHLSATAEQTHVFFNQSNFIPS